jgi:hypothetical protein
MHRSVSRVCRWGFVTSAALLLSAVPLLAADKLPKDGAWARYYVVAKLSDGSERVTRTTVRFVGTVVEKGEKHRWVELVERYERDSNGKRLVDQNALKFLISEKHLRTASNPIQHFVRGWYGSVDKPPQEMDASRRSQEIFDAFHGQSLLFLAGPSKGSKPTKNPHTIDYQNGRLSIKSGRAGTYTSEYHPATVKIVLSWKSKYELWTHKSVPLGMAALKYRLVQSRTDEKGKTTEQRSENYEYTVEAWGTDAKSAFPDAK